MKIHIYLLSTILVVICGQRRHLSRDFNTAALAALIDVSKGHQPQFVSRKLDPFVSSSQQILVPRIAKSELKRMVQQATLNVKHRLEVVEPNILSSGAIQKQGSQGWYLAASARTKIVAKNYSTSALISEEVSRIAANTFKLSRDQITYGLPTVDVSSTTLGTNCPFNEAPIACLAGKYRSFNGHCNNVQNPSWGSSATAYLRYLPAHYADGVTIPRRAGSGEELPSTRDVSVAVHHGSSPEHPHITTLLVFFGEFVFHDLSHTAQAVGYKGHRIRCCGLEKDLVHPECYPIKVRKSDPLYAEMKQSCMEYVRSCPSVHSGCGLGPRDQINQVTSFLDGSVIYGSSEEESKLLRLFSGGELKSQKMDKKRGIRRELLPPVDNSHDCRIHDKKNCFLAGDIRVNENMGLTLMHTLWMREHNRLARNLAKLNPHWTDEQLYQEARRIVGAQFQHIVYNELLPAILGNEIVDKYELRLQTSGYFNGYDMNSNPGIDNAIASAVFPFMFSMLPTKFERYSSRLTLMGTKLMGDTYFNPGDLYDNSKFDEYLMGLLSQNANNPDLAIANDMTNSVKVEAREGFDLVAMILQQGRDHGIPGYTKWRNFCKVGSTVTNFDDLTDLINITTVKKLSKIYKNVHDIDLFTGGLAEESLPGSVVGPTFSCLLGRQFYFIRVGDRYWYENDLPPSSFTLEQLKEIRQTTLARIICDNGDRMDFVQPLSMVTSDSYLNAFQYCTNIPEMDLSKWKETSSKFRFSDDLIKNSFREAGNQMSAINRRHREAFNKRVGVASGQSPQVGHLRFVKPDPFTLAISNRSTLLELASTNIIRSLMEADKDREASEMVMNDMDNLMTSLSRMDVEDLFGHREEHVLTEVFTCVESDLPCDYTSPFRTTTGWCNNLQNPEFGTSLRVFARFLPPAYGDGIGTMRSRARSGNPLPSPRLISTKIHFDISNPHLRYALITMQWGQFLDHDLTFTPMYMGPDNSVLNCKDCDSQQTVHRECRPIPIPDNDPFFPARDSRTNKRRCLHFVRSINAQSKLGPREQMNQITPYIDASNVYGSNKCVAKKLRSFSGGKMNVTRHSLRAHKPLLPQTNSNPECKAPSRLCFDAGDVRSSEQPSLACMHTIFLREHNRLAEKLQALNPEWDDEMLYQTARKIVGAAAQRITYGEFLPRVLGLDYMKKFDLNLLQDGYYEGYDPTCDARLFNEFAAAVFRFGHSLLKPAFERLNRQFEAVSKPLRLRGNFFNSDMLFSEHAIDNILRGILTQSVETLDNAITEEVSNHLFEDTKVPFSGMDLISLNIQRARDHGIPPYNEYRVACNLSRAKTFDDLAAEIPSNIVERLKKVYEHVNDIDLFTGGLTEKPLHGGSVGPTFGCILGIQFQKLKRCDRYWHETSDPFIRFTERQLVEIRKISLAKIVCENSDTINYIQRQAMDLPDSFLNPRMPCNTLPSPDLTAWRERGSNCDIGSQSVASGQTVRKSPCVMCTCTKEGEICNSIRVRNCFELLSTFQMDEVERDPVCRVQCAFLFNLVRT